VFAGGDDILPIAVSAVFRSSLLIRRKCNDALPAGKSSMRCELAGIGVERRNVIAQILFMDVCNYTAPRSLV
jgi:hypothetical protein